MCSPHRAGRNIGRIEAGGAAVVLWDLGGAAPLRSIWDKYFTEAHALMCVCCFERRGLTALLTWHRAPRSYVVDAAAGERLEESRAALERVRARVWNGGFRPAALTRPCQALASRELEGAPLLLLANKSDVAGASRQSAHLPRRTCAATSPTPHASAAAAPGHDGCATVATEFAALTAGRAERPSRVVEARPFRHRLSPRLHSC